MTVTPFEPKPGSARARLAATGARVALRPVAEALPPNRFGVAISRGILATSLTTLGPVRPHTAVTAVSERTGSGQIRGEWVRAHGVRRADAVVLYLHGSGYALCSPRTHRGLTSRLSAFAELPVFSIDYRLAPRHRFPAAAEDVARAFDWLIAQGFAADRIVVAGDSAGGHLALDLCLSRLRAGQALPPTLIQAGGREMLAADAHALHRRLRATGTTSRLEVWPDQVHVFQAMPRLVPEADAALRRGASFLRAAVPVEIRQPQRRSA